MKNILLLVFAVLFSNILLSQEINLIDSEFNTPTFSLLDNDAVTQVPEAERTHNEEVVDANCFCVISYVDMTNYTSRSGTCLDLTSRVNMSFTGPLQQSTQNQRRCDRRCSDVAASLSQSDLDKIAACACTAGKPHGTVLRAFSKLGTRRYSSAHRIGVLENRPATYQTTCECPDGWVVDNGQTDPGRKCKKQLCKVAYPISNRQLAEMPGFIWDNYIYQWISGDCETTEATPTICRIRK